ncbi:MAG: hypothetical protein MRY77_14515 [Rhodobacteraceae bacterium]|nr:hypothetical protein [Paracoccaceae bacterium]
MKNLPKTGGRHVRGENGRLHIEEKPTQPAPQPGEPTDAVSEKPAPAVKPEAKKGERS